MAGTMEPTYSETRTVKKITLDWLSDASGNVSGTDTKVVSGVIERIVFVPDGGGTAPTALHDIYINDADGADVLHGLGYQLPAAAVRDIISGKKCKAYDQASATLYQTDGYSGSDADVDDTERYSSDIDLEFHTGAVIEFKFDASGATDNLLLYLYGGLTSTWDNDEIAIWSTEVTSDGSEDLYRYEFDDSYTGHYRFGMLSGATDTFEMDLSMRRFIVIEFNGVAVDGALSLVVANAGNAKGGKVILYMR